MEALKHRRLDENEMRCIWAEGPCTDGSEDQLGLPGSVVEGPICSQRIPGLGTWADPEGNAWLAVNHPFDGCLSVTQH